MTLRALIFWPHLIAGVLAGAIILVMSVTGVALTYERQLVAWSNSHLRSVRPSERATPLPVETLLTRLRNDHPEMNVSAVTLTNERDAPVLVQDGRRTVYVD